MVGTIPTYLVYDIVTQCFGTCFKAGYQKPERVIFSNQRPDTQLRIRAFCPGIFAFLAVFRVVVSNWGTRGSRGTETPARQPGIRVNPFQRGSDQGPRWDPECYPKTGVVEPCPISSRKADSKPLPDNNSKHKPPKFVIGVGWPLPLPPPIGCNLSTNRKRKPKWRRCVAA